jgi:hypothetical protein
MMLMSRGRNEDIDANRTEDDDDDDGPAAASVVVVGVF